MRVLIVHNFYDSRFPSGENNVVQSEYELLSRSGHEVAIFAAKSEDFLNLTRYRRFLVVINLIFGFPRNSNFNDTLNLFQPDLVHMHNLFPYIGWEIIDRCRANDIRIVQTLHNYRLNCIGGNNFRNGRICTLCSTKNFGRAGIIHKCYRNSRIQSLIMTVAMIRYRSRLQFIEAFIVMSPFMKNWLAKLQVPVNKIVTKMTAFSMSELPNEIRVSERSSILFVGRFSEDKGIELLIRSFLNSALIDMNWDLILIGDGPQFSELASKYSQNTSIKFLGSMSIEQVLAHMQTTDVLCIPSVWFEGSPGVFSQAVFVGCPVMLSNLGSLGSIPDQDWLFKVSPTFEGWTDALSSLPSWLAKVDRSQIVEWSLKNTSEQNTLLTLNSIYRES